MYEITKHGFVFWDDYCIANHVMTWSWTWWFARLYTINIHAYTFICWEWSPTCICIYFYILCIYSHAVSWHWSKGFCWGWSTLTVITQNTPLHLAWAKHENFCLSSDGNRIANGVKVPCVGLNSHNLQLGIHMAHVLFFLKMNHEKT